MSGGHELPLALGAGAVGAGAGGAGAVGAGAAGGKGAVGAIVGEGPGKGVMPGGGVGAGKSLGQGGGGPGRFTSRTPQATAPQRLSARPKRIPSSSARSPLMPPFQ